MARRGWLGWAVAGALALGWLNSGKEPVAPPPSEPPARSQTAPPALSPPAKEVAPAPPAQTRAPPVPPLPKEITTPSPSSEAGPQQTLYATAKVRLRATPSTSAAIVWTVPMGTEVVSLGRSDDWHRVRVATYDGWIRADLLTDRRPAIQPSTLPAAPLIRQPQPQPQSARSGEPTRDPYVGTCDCPYDLMRNGRRCGARSAYSRPGGRNPVCYF